MTRWYLTAIIYQYELHINNVEEQLLAVWLMLP